MSKINSCYPLCPLIDQKSFFGVSDDCESGYVVVTLGKNMVVRYKLLDQKQVNSWNTKVRLSSLVVFDRNIKKYVGVFNSNMIQMWSECDVDLNKVKKYKFKKSIHCVLSNSYIDADDPSSVIVFKDGCIAPLTLETLANRKDIEAVGEELGFLGVNETDLIEDAHLLMSRRNIIVALICSDSLNKNLVCHFLPLKTDLFQPVSFNLSCRKNNDSSQRNNNTGSDCKLTGYAFINGDSSKLVTLWSDGGLHCLDYSASDSDLRNIADQYPGQKIMDIEIINTKLKTAILPLDNIGCHLAIYGSDPSEEGALLTIVNIKHKIVQCKYDLKLYCMSPRLWSGGPTDVLLIVGQHLAVAHYRLVSQKLAALIGSQENSSLSTNLLHAKWNEKNQESELQSFENMLIINSNNSDAYFCDNMTVRLDGEQLTELKERVYKLLNEGLSEAGICNQLIPTFIETRDTVSLIWLFNKFSDIPFHCTLLVLSYCIQRIKQNNSVEDYDDENDDVVSEFASSKLNNTNVDSNLKVLLFCAFSTSVVPDNKALSLVRSTLSVQSGLKLMEFLLDLMIQYPSNMKLIEWAILLLDSYYQSFIISKNKSMIKIFKQLNDCVKNQITILSTWQDLVLLIKMIRSGGSAPTSVTLYKKNCLYSSEELNIY